LHQQARVFDRPFWLGVKAGATAVIYSCISSINPIAITDEKGAAYSTNGLFFKTKVHGQAVHLLFYSHKPKSLSHGNRHGNFVMNTDVSIIFKYSL